MKKNVEEEIKKKFRKELTQFQNNPVAEEIVYPENLSKLERKFIHEIADELLLIHGSVEKRIEKKKIRYIVVRKLPPLLQTGKFIAGSWTPFILTGNFKSLDVPLIT